MAAQPEYLLDASALLALMLNEAGEKAVRDVLGRCAIHTVNVAEVIKKLVQKGVPFPEACASVEELHLKIDAQFEMDQAAACGRLMAEAAAQGLSLGDCVCLTAAASHNRIALTAERRWTELSGRSCFGSAAPLRVQLIR